MLIRKQWNSLIKYDKYLLKSKFIHYYFFMYIWIRCLTFTVFNQGNPGISL